MIQRNELATEVNMHRRLLALTQQVSILNSKHLGDNEIHMLNESKYIFKLWQGHQFVFKTHKSLKTQVKTVFTWSPSSIPWSWFFLFVIASVTGLALLKNESPKWLYLTLKFCFSLRDGDRLGQTRYSWPIRLNEWLINHKCHLLCYYLQSFFSPSTINKVGYMRNQIYAPNIAHASLHLKAWEIRICQIFPS